jgi:hypothetical protein
MCECWTGRRAALWRPSLSGRGIERKVPSRGFTTDEAGLVPFCIRVDSATSAPRACQTVPDWRILEVSSYRIPADTADGAVCLSWLLARWLSSSLSHSSCAADEQGKLRASPALHISVGNITVNFGYSIRRGTCTTARAKNGLAVLQMRRRLHNTASCRYHVTTCHIRNFSNLLKLHPITGTSSNPHVLPALLASRHTTTVPCSAIDRQSLHDQRIAAVKNHPCLRSRSTITCLFVDEYYVLRMQNN